MALKKLQLNTFYKILISIIFLFFLNKNTIAQVSVNCKSGIFTTGGLNSICKGKSTQLYYGDSSGNKKLYQWYRGVYPSFNKLTGETRPLLQTNFSDTFYIRVIDTSNPKWDTGFCFKIITLDSQPKATFTNNPNTGCGKTIISFSSSPLNNISNTTYNWDFGDNNNNTSNLKDPSHSYLPSVTTNYNVTLIVTNTNGTCPDTAKSSITINAGADASFNIQGSNVNPIFNSSNIKIGYKVCSALPSIAFIFDDASSTRLSNTSYKISWGDGSNDTSFTTFPSAINHNYPVGLYTLTYTVSNPGCVNKNTAKIFLGSNPAVGISSPGNTDLCAPATLTFNIDTNVANKNPPGTLYILKFNDGSNDTSFAHPPPATVTHTFTKSSCGYSSPFGSQNEFYAQLTASNPCKSTDSYVTGITITDKPKTRIGGPEVACIGKEITLVNGGSITVVPFGVSNCSSGNVVWDITPKTGWNISLGALGSDNGSNDPANWTSGALKIKLIFSIPGLYTVKLKSGGATCNFDSAFNQICVNPVPTASVKAFKNSICAGDTTSLFGKMDSVLCGSVDYKWSVVYFSNLGCKPDTMNYEFFNNDSTSQTTKIKFNTPGFYDVTFEAKFRNSGCDKAAASVSINVKGKPYLNIDSLPITCKNTPLNPVLSDSCNTLNTTYLWNFQGGNPSTITAFKPTNIIMQQAGNAIKVGVKATNECGSFDTSRTVRVIDAPTFTLNPTVLKTCNGRVANIGLSTSFPNTFYTWTATANPTMTGAVDQTTPIKTTILSNTLTTSSLNNDTVYYKIVSEGPTPFSCKGDSSIATVIVQGGVTAAKAGNDTVLCNQTTYQLQGNFATGGGGIWKQVGGAKVTMADSSIYNTTLSNLIIGEFAFAWEIKSSVVGCSSSIDTIVVKNRPIITKANAGNDFIKCNLGLINSSILNGNFNATRPYEYGTWEFVGNANGATFNNKNNPNTTIDFLNEGIYTLTWTLRNDATTTDSSCNMSRDTMVITVKAYPAGGFILGKSNICIYDNPGKLTLNSFSASANLQWMSTTSPSSYIDILNSKDSFINAGVLGQTTYFKVKLYQTGCTDTIYSSPFSITIDDSSRGGKTYPVLSEVCTNSGKINLTLFLSVGFDYKWIYSKDGAAYNSFSPAKTSGSIEVDNNPYIQNTTSQVIVYEIKALVKNGACPADSSIKAVIKVYPNTEIAEAGVNQSLCNQTSTTLAATTPTSGNGTWSQISGPNTASFSSTTSATASISNLTIGTYKLKWQLSGSSSNICPATFDTVIITNYDTLNNNVIPVKDTLCAPQSLTINSANIITGGDGSYTYQWQQSVDKITWNNVLTNGTNEVYSSISTASYFYRRIVFSATCSDTSNIVYINIQPSLGNNVINANQTICINTNPNLINGAVPTGGTGVFAYQWIKMSNGNWNNINAQISSTYQPPLSNAVGIDSFKRLVSSGYCINDSSNLITIETKPNAKAFFNFPYNQLCAPATLDTNLIKPLDFVNGNASYEWYINNNLVSTGIYSLNYLIPNNGDSALVKLKTISPFGCKNDSIQQKFYTIKTPTVSYSKSIARGCGPLSVNFTNTSTPAGLGTYIWKTSNGLTFTQTNPPTIIFDADNSINRKDTVYYITLLSITQCDTVKYIDSVTVLPKPRALFQPDATVGCSIFKFRALNNSIGTHNTYTWNFGDKSPIITDTLLGYKLHNYTTNKTDTFYVKLIAQNTCGIDSFIINIIVYPNTIIPKLILDGTSTNTCAPTRVKFINNTIGATKFTVNFGDSTPLYLSVKNPDTIFHVYVNGGNYVATLKAENSCTDSTVTVPIKLYSKPKAAFTTALNGYCIYKNVAFTNLSDTGLQYEWYFNGVLTSNNFNVNYSFNVARDYNVVLIVKSVNPNGSVCSDTAKKTITIHPLPDVTISSNAKPFNCQPYLYAATGVNQVGSLYYWNFYDATSVDTTKAGYIGTHTFNKIGDFDIRLIVVTSFGCTDTSYAKVKVIETPKPNFNQSDSVFCTPGKLVNFVNTTTYSATDPINFEWYVNGNLLTTTKNFSYNFNASTSITSPVIFNVKLITINAAGCKDSITKKIIIQPKAQALFSLAKSQGCAPGSIQINNQSLYANVFKWYVDGSLFSSNIAPIPLLINVSDKVYNIKLVADNTLGCGADSLTLQYTTYPKPVADFSINTVNACTGKAVVNLFDISNVKNGSISKWNWNFGDGTASNAQNPIHPYQVDGLYNITLFVIDDKGCTSDITKKSIKNFGKPIARFNVTDVCKGTNVIPVNLSSVGFGSTAITSYLWNFGDGTVLNGLQPVHAYTAEGVYTVTLIITSDSSCVPDTISNKIKIFGLPKASFTFNDNCKNITTNFINTSSFGLGQNNIGISKWDLGNGLFSNVIDASTIYKDTGTYKVSLIVSGNKCPNLLDTTFNFIKIYEARKAISYPRINATRNTNIPLLALNGGVSYLWNPTTGLTFNNIQNPTASYNTTHPNIINYTITIKDSFGCTIKDTQQVWIFTNNDILLPTAFTPNGDRANDLFAPLYLGISKIEYFRIFDRWGKVVFETSDMSKVWDGTLNGKPLPMDTYTWMIKAIDKNTEQLIRKGNVTLIRD